MAHYVVDEAQPALTGLAADSPGGGVGFIVSYPADFEAVPANAVIMPGDERAGAVFTPDRRYRYVLHRIWHNRKPLGAFIGANPSKANEHRSDNTVTRCINYAIAWGWGGMYMLNLRAWVDTNPGNVPTDGSSVGVLNDYYIRQVCWDVLRGQNVVAAWGHLGVGRDTAVTAMLAALGIDLLCLGVTGNGAPRHPSRLANTSTLRPWVPK